MRKSLIMAIAALVFMLPASYVYSADASVKQQIKTAKSEMRKAKKMGFLWRDVGKFIKNAEKALKKGDKKTALKLAKKATYQARMGQQQAKDQANAGPTF